MAEGQNILIFSGLGADNSPNSLAAGVLAVFIADEGSAAFRGFEFQEFF